LLYVNIIYFLALLVIDAAIVHIIIRLLKDPSPEMLGLKNPAEIVMFLGLLAFLVGIIQF